MNNIKYKKYKLHIGILAALIVLMTVSPFYQVYAATPPAAQEAPIYLTIDGLYIPTDVPPVIVNDRTLVPARAVFEALGGVVEWQDDVTPAKVSIAYSDMMVVLTVNSTVALVNGKENTLDVPAQIINNRTLIPVRFVSEALNFSVSWDENERTVNMYSYNNPAPEKSVSIDNIDVTASESGTRVSISGSGNLTDYTSLADWNRFTVDIIGASLNTTTGSLEWHREISVVEGVDVSQFVSGSASRNPDSAAGGAADGQNPASDSGGDTSGVRNNSGGTSDSGTASGKTNDTAGSAASGGTASSSAGSASDGKTGDTGTSSTASGGTSGTSTNPASGGNTSDTGTASSSGSGAGSTSAGNTTSGSAVTESGISGNKPNGSTAAPPVSGQNPARPSNVVRFVFNINESVTPVISFSPSKDTMYIDFPQPSIMFAPLIDGKLSVVLDPGHGAETAGKRSPDNSLMEYEFNRDMAAKIKYHLERHGVEVLITTPDNTDLSLADRCKFANESDGDVFVSLHANAFGHGWTSSNGWEIYVYRKGSYSEQLAKAIHSATIPASGLSDRGIKSERFYVIRNTNMPAVLIEHGFYSNKTEVELLKSNDFRERLAVMDAKGILNFLGVTWIEQ
ncbi:MAG: N-acetylmuramoyl-L-alanine amidase [Clostridiales Family XIII bacterium]|jgi:N-acetylmuramoyl-L-alanine amidase|nr:N-acetylmuramoyl-L-alanine amidase [Clostridiales Family XIII bacterium]